MTSFQPTALEGLVDARQKLESQQQENQGVQSEFASLDGDSNIYKLIGPVLLKQDKNEAIMAVNGRLEFIEKEMYVRCSIRGANFFFSAAGIDNCSAVNELKLRSRNLKRRPIRSDQR